MKTSYLLLDIFIPLKGQSGNRFENRKEFIKDFLEFREKERYSVEKQKNLKYKTLRGKICAKITFHFQKEYIGDLDNLMKSLFDALQRTKIIANDNQIRKAIVEIKDDSLFEGISLQLENYAK